MFINPSRAKRLTLPIIIGGVAVMVLKIVLLMRFRTASSKPGSPSQK
jgi:hypothetical protein